MGHYPSEVVLKEMREFDVFKRDIDELIELIRNEWEFADCGYFTYKRKYRGIRLLKISTGGWSGNEEIIDALRSNFIFWSSLWYTHRTGGHYSFRIHDMRSKEDKRS